LQALRKAGRIAYDRTDGWSVVHTATTHVHTGREVGGL
jgi:hypothetical protein